MVTIFCPYLSGSNNIEWEWNSDISLQILHIQVAQHLK